MIYTRRHIIMSGLAASTLPAGSAMGATATEITWDDLIPPGVPYSEIVGMGETDEVNDIWLPVYDENGTKLNQTLDGSLIRMPGYILPIEVSADGVHDFVLVPYVGACLHTPPPPPNQLVFANTPTPWPSDQLWDAVWVVGTLRTQLKNTQVAQTGYSLSVTSIEAYEW